MKFIVIEGLDGSGKSTQVKLIQNHFNEQGIKFKYLHFPIFESPVFGDLVARFLRGDLGDINSVNPYLVALLYAGDRHNASDTIKRWLNDGFLVLVDRYVLSNIAFQCAKTKDINEQDKLADWIFDVEYNYYKIPKPDVNIFLDVPFSFTKARLQEQRNGDDRNYLNGKQDIHEKDLDFQEKVRQVYLRYIDKESTFSKIDCNDSQGNMLPTEQIFDKIITHISPLK